MNKVSHIRFDGTQVEMPNGTYVLTALGERRKGRNRNKKYQDPETGKIMKYKHEVTKMDDKIQNQIKRLQNRWLKSYIREINKTKCQPKNQVT